MGRAGNGQGIGGDILGDHTAGADQRAVADLDRCDQGDVGTDESAFSDVGVVLGKTIVIAGDGAGADVGRRPDAGVADIGQVINLGGFFDGGVFDLNEIADVDVFGNIGTGAQPCEWPDDGAVGDFRPLDMTKGADVDIVADVDAGPEHH